MDQQNTKDTIPEVIPDTFGLLVFGRRTRLYTRTVSLFVQFLTVILAIQFCVDLWAWYNAWEVGLGGWVMPLVLGAAFASLMLIYDRTILTSDNNGGGWARYLTRGAMIFAMAFLTSVPVELAVFRPDIERIIDNTEKMAVDAIRSKAKAEEETRFDKLIADTKERMGHSQTAQLAAAEKDLADYQIISTKKRKELTNKIDEEKRGAAVAAGGGGVNPAKGIGPETLQHRENIVGYVSQLKELDETAAKAIEALTKARDEVASGNADALETKLNQLNTDKEAAVLATKTMKPAMLAERFGGEYLQSRGFIARFQTLEKITGEKWSAEWKLLWGCRAAMIAFGIIILGLKIGSPVMVKSYFNLEDQAKAGHPEAIAVLQVRNVADNTSVPDPFLAAMPQPQPTVPTTAAPAPSTTPSAN